MSRGLGVHQRKILSWLFDKESAFYYRKRNNWYPGKFHAGNWSTTDRAVYSRALRRLEERGLIERENSIFGNDYPGHKRRTNEVTLTAEGLELAEAYTLTKSPISKLKICDFVSEWEIAMGRASGVTLWDGEGADSEQRRGVR